MMMALVLVASTTAFAGDSDDLKAIKKAKTYAEAAQLLKTAQLANNEEKAAAYNKLVDLAMDIVAQETGTMAQNQAAAQLGKGKMEPVDSIGLCDAICNAIDAAVECNKYDQLPNEKRKVKPLFDKKNAERIWPVRFNLVNLAIDLASTRGHDIELKYWGKWLDSYTDPLFAEQDHESDKANIGQIAYWAGRYAYDAKNNDLANKYLDIAMTDPAQKKEALNFKLFIHRSNMSTKADSLQFIETLKGLYAQDPENDMVLGLLFEAYDGMKDKAAQNALLDNHLAKFPNSWSALANKGMMAVSDNNIVEAVDWFRKAATANPNEPVVQSSLGTCLSALAGTTEDAAKRKELYGEAIQALDKAKELDPDKVQVNWGYNRYQAYYGLYGEDDARTKAAQNDMR